MFEEIIFNDMLLAIIVRNSYKKEGIEFFTPRHYSQQLGYMNRPKGYKIEAHTHKIIERKVFVTQEVLVIKSGSIKLSLFGNDETFVTEKTLLSGDVILLAQGGHSIEMLEDTEIIEIKQGPYMDDDKVKISVKTYNECNSNTF